MRESTKTALAILGGVALASGVALGLDAVGESFKSVPSIGVEWTPEKEAQSDHARQVEKREWQRRYDAERDRLEKAEGAK